MQDRLRTQYKDASNLNARIQLHLRFSTSTVLWQRWVFDHLNLPFGVRILELGCGPGDLWSQNAERLLPNWEMVLTDFSPGMLEAAQKNLASVPGQFSYKLVDAQDIPFQDRSFDAVVANHMLYHVPDRPRALVEIRRVLKPGGRLYASTVGGTHMAEMWALLSPFTPHLLERFTRASTGFTLENGAEQLECVFDQVQRMDFADSLEITDAEAVIAYLQSSTTMVGFVLTGDVVMHIREQVTAAIDAFGAFHVTKTAGLLIGR
ncbi:MAG: class I SAM-dependent methyltransferase [Anaerolineae bacterium]|nr:class I SAM-dependent methyltransferase [Anaerolineae bacterium]